MADVVFNLSELDDSIPNAAPQLDLNGSDEAGIDFATTFYRGTPVSIVDSDFTLTDANSSTLVGVTITIELLFEGAAEPLSADTSGTSIIASYNYDSNTITGILTLTGTDTIANYEQVLRSITYNNTAAVVTTIAPRTIQFIVDDGQAESNTSTVATTTLTLTNQSANSVVYNPSDLDGFVIIGINAGDRPSIRGTADINGDGINDLIIGEADADPNGRENAGQSYVVFGSSTGFSASIDLSSLDGSNGFLINGINAGGRVVGRPAGDINGDGIEDLMIAAFYGIFNGRENAGQSYVVFGSSTGFSASFDLSSLDGSNGFVINGINAGDRSSIRGTADINGDGINDLIIVASDADPNGRENAGQSYVVFGSSTGFSASIDLSSLDGSNGFVINGINAGDGSYAVTAGDINGDGIDDLIILPTYVYDYGRENAGRSYIVFGSSTGFNASFDLSSLDGSNGFVIDDLRASRFSRLSFDHAGDMNGDGLDDLIINISSNIYVVFGRSEGLGATLELGTLDGSNGFVFNAYGRGYSSPTYTSAGDINGDGFDDLIIGVPGGGNFYNGTAYVLFGKGSGFSARLDPRTLDGSNGFVINGLDERDYLGRSVRSAGDFNGDGFDDFMINDYLLFGKSGGFRANFDLSLLDGRNGFITNGFYSTSVGDINGDGFDDLSIASGVLFGFATGSIDEPLNEPPVAVNDTATTDEDTAVNISVLANDSDPDNDPLKVTAVNRNTVTVGSAITLSSGALLTLNADSTFTYDPNGQFETLAVGESSSDSFTYTISDGDFTRTATVNLTINGVNDAPTAVVSVFNLSTLNGNNGFVINGIDAGDGSGSSVSGAGDINGDGFDDVIIAAPDVSLGRRRYVAQNYVVFGSSSGFSASLDLSSLDGSNGFVINGIQSRDRLGSFVSSAGDINGDGFDDVIIATAFADPNGQSEAGQSYVVFGSSSGFSASLDLSSLDGSNGFVINGIDAGDALGSSVSSAGDINDDSIDDLIIGAPGANQSYVVFGSSSGFSASLDLSSLDGSNGFVINGINAGDALGLSVSSAGDINGDGFDDLIIGAPGADPNGEYFAGESYVVFGKSSGFSASLDLSSLDGSNGFVINGIDADDRLSLGFSVSSAGDINGDGFDDLIVVAFGSRSYDNQTYVVFGKSNGFSASFDLSSLDGSNGFVITPISGLSSSDRSITSAGDINGDGFDDLIIGAYGASPNGEFDAGQSYVLFGKSGGFSASFDLSNLDGSNGFVLNGIDAGDNSGYSVSGAGDINGDGISDLIIGAPDAYSNGEFNAGQSYVVFGFATGATTNEDTTVNILARNILRRYTDVDGDTLSITNFTNPSNATLTLNDNGTPSVTDDDYFTYTPNANYNGTDSFSYTVSDGNGGSIDGTFNLNIRSINDAPIVANTIADITTTESSAFSFTFDADTFSDVDAGDTLTYTATLADDSPLPDWLAFNADTRTFSGTPDDTDVGTISLKVIATDSSNASVSESFDLTVTALNFTGTKGRDVLTGTGSNNIIDGKGGNDDISGGAGDDILVGGTGSDVLTGGAGNDLFVYTSIRDARDRITDFSPSADKIVLTDLFASFNLGGLNYETATAQGYLGFRSQGNNTAVLIDPDGLTGRAVATSLLTVLDVSSNTLANADNFVF
ncbi:putative outer membrane adhesin [Nostoc sp. NIES-4103]|nr:putative outer membrane adhesin [Nostoc sp. NIES-4103]